MAFDDNGRASDVASPERATPTQQRSCLTAASTGSGRPGLRRVALRDAEHGPTRKPSEQRRRAAKAKPREGEGRDGSLAGDQVAREEKIEDEEEEKEEKTRTERTKN